MHAHLRHEGSTTRTGDLWTHQHTASMRLCVCEGVYACVCVCACVCTCVCVCVCVDAHAHTRACFVQRAMHTGERLQQQDSPHARTISSGGGPSSPEGSGPEGSASTNSCSARGMGGCVCRGVCARARVSFECACVSRFAPFAYGKAPSTPCGAYSAC